MTPDAAIEQRWGFLSPWCNVLQYRIHYHALEDDGGDLWRPQPRALQVILPTHVGIYGEFRDPETFQIEFQNTREALALLAAVAHVDYHGWKYLLANHCGVDFGNMEILEQEIQVSFVLLMEHLTETDLIQLCGVTQRRILSPGYVNSLQRIAAMDHNLQQEKPGFDIEIPVRVIISSTTVYKNNSGSIQVLLSIQHAEKLIRDEWESYNWSLENQPVESGQLRCTFLLEPMLADLRELGCGPEIAETMAKFVGENVWFSQLSIRAEMDQQREVRATAMSFRQMMAVVFDATRRSQELANTRFCSPLMSDGGNNPLQIRTISLQCDCTLGPSQFESMFSAIVLTQTTKKITIRLGLDSCDRATRKIWWKWLAYGCFSKRARTYSALESLIITDIDDINTVDLRDFATVLSSKHTEEALYGSPCGATPEREMLLKKGALVQWLLTKDGQPSIGAHPVKFSDAIPLVRTFSDDGKSEEVNVVIPGFGRCLVQRNDLVVHKQAQFNDKSWGLKSLTLRFAECKLQNARKGLPRLLAAIGSSLLFLTIDGSGEELDENVILKNCPNLLELSLRKGWVGVGLNFSEFHSRQKSIPKLRFRWKDIPALTTDLSNVRNPFTKCARQLNICLMNLEGFGDNNVRYDPTISTYLDALLQMLAVNQTLEYLEVTVPSECHNYGDYFRIHHLRAIKRCRKLSTKAKVAFFSVISAKVKLSLLKSSKAIKCKPSSSRLNQNGLDRRVISKIFEFAASAVFRQVYFRETLNDDTPSEMC